MSPGTNPSGLLLTGDQECHLLGVGMTEDREGRFSYFLPVKSLRMKQEEQQGIPGSSVYSIYIWTYLMVDILAVSWHVYGIFFIIVRS
jgi:hypothetical protein